MGVHKHKFPLAMHDWGVFPTNQRCRMHKKIVKLIYFIEARLITSFFSKFLMKFLINNIKYLVSNVVSGALSGAIKIELLRSMTMESSF